MSIDLAAVVTGRGLAPRLESVTVASPGPGEVLVRIAASGVCHTDLTAIDDGAGYPYPAVFGHEGAGVVEVVGAGVTHVRTGDHVVLSFASCGECASCGEGHPAYCRRFGALNRRPDTHAMTLDNSGEAVSTGFMRQSSWATRVLAHASNTVRIDPDVPWSVAAPLGCGVLTGAGTVLNVLAPRPHDAMLVIGAGAVGLSAVMAAHAAGCRRILVSDPLPSRLDLALELGATEALAPHLIDTAISDGGPVRFVIDTVGTQATTDAALDALAPRGTCATVALHPGANRVSIPQSTLLWGRTFTGVIEGDAVVERDVPRLVALWRAGLLPIEKLVTTYPFDDIARAIADTRAGRTIKAVLVTADADREVREPASAPLLERLRAGLLDDLALDELWRTLPPVETGELRGLWRGWSTTPGHRAERMLERLGWYGKRFHADDHVEPIVVRTPDGDLVADEKFARGGASLWRIERAGVLTAAMVYDAQPIIDSFTRLSPDAVLGVMGGRGVQDDGRDFYFVLEHVD